MNFSRRLKPGAPVNGSAWGKVGSGVLSLLIATDLVVAVLAYVGAFAARIYFPLPWTEHLLPFTPVMNVAHPVALLVVTQLGILYAFGLYDLRTLGQRGGTLGRVATALGIQLLAAGAWFFFRNDPSFPRSVLAAFWLLNTLGVTGARVWLSRWLAGGGSLRVILVGAAADVEAFVTGLADLHPAPRLEVVGVVGIQDSDGQTPSASGAPWLGCVDALPEFLRRTAVDEVILVSAASWKDTLVERLTHLPAETGRPRMLVVPSVYDVLVGRVSSLRLHDIPLVEVLQQPAENFTFLVKSAVDRALAGVLLILSLPLIGLAAGLVKLSSPGPAFYRQRRVGRHEKEFTLYKLRTMRTDAEAETGPVLADVADPRVTAVGRHLRTTRIDELPQLFNVLGGSMSLVGPRPERPEFVAEFRRVIPGYIERFQVRPGVTGLAQINAGYRTSAELKLKYDLSYIYNYSLWLDLRVLAETVKIVLTRQGM